MAISVFESAIYRDLYRDADMAALFTDSAQVRAMMLVEGVLAKTQAEAGVIPQDSGFFIHRAGMEIQIDPSGLAAQTAATGDPVPALLAALHKALEAPEHAKFVHFGVSSDDILDTALILRLRQALKLLEKGLTDRATPMTDVTAVLEQLRFLRQPLLQLRLAGPDGQLTDMGESGATVRAAMAAGLGLSDPVDAASDLRQTLRDLGTWLADAATLLSHSKPSAERIALQTVLRQHSAALHATQGQPPAVAKSVEQLVLPTMFMGLAAMLLQTADHPQP